MGFSELSVIMQFLIAASLLVAGTNAQLVAYANGAIAPFDPNNAAATAEHQKAIAEAGGVNFPFGVHATGVVVPHVFGYPFHYGKRDADAQLVTYPNGAVTPYDPNLAVATNAHLVTRFGHYGYAGYPHGVVYGKREAEAQIPVGLVTGYAGVHHGVGYPYHFGYGYGVAPVVSPFVAHPNGALVPAEPKEVVDARAEHLAAHAEALTGWRIT